MCSRRGHFVLVNGSMLWMRADSPQFGPPLDLDFISEETKFGLVADLKKKTATEEDIEMNSEIWSSLPEEILLLILANLSTLINGRFRAVCKQWKHLLSPGKSLSQSISSTVPLCSSPAFLFGCLRPSYLTNPLVEDLYLLQADPTCPIYKLSLDFLAPEKATVFAACKSLLCCSKDRAPTSFHICNPVTRTWISLPPPAQLNRWDFIGLAFDSSTRVCTLVIGRNQDENNKVEIYDSESNGWTKLQMNNALISIYGWTKLQMNNALISIFPTGEGVYSRGKFYWINKSHVDGIRWRFDVVAFDVAKRSWDVISHPQRLDESEFDYFPDWKLTGCDGNVVLVYNKELSLWKLIEDEDEGERRCRWSELQAFPRSLCEEALCGRNITKDFNSQRISRRMVKRCNYPHVMVNSCGWVSVYLPRNMLVVFDAEGRMMHGIEGKLLKIFERSYLIPVKAYEINNIWWPS